MKIDTTLLDYRIQKKLISKHTFGTLAIYNYTPEAVSQKEWDKYTRMARGLILKEDGTVVARPFAKFFNLDQTTETSLKNLPAYQPEVMEKMDGSLGILYIYEGEYRIATRGSFISDQALWATEWLRENKPDLKPLDNLTYLFEIIYPENRIVVNYGDRAELVLIGLVHNYTGAIYPYKSVVEEAERLGFSYPKRFNLKLYEIQALSERKGHGDEEEGFVLFYPDENLQVKIKYNDYIKLHRLTFGITVKSIWELMRDGQDVEKAFIDAPDEVIDWVKEWKHFFRKQEQFHIAESTRLLGLVLHMETRKEQALYLQKESPEYCGIVFRLLDGKEYLPGIYKMFAPGRDDANKSFKVVPKGDL